MNQKWKSQVDLRHPLLEVVNTNTPSGGSHQLIYFLLNCNLCLLLKPSFSSNMKQTCVLFLLRVVCYTAWFTISSAFSVKVAFSFISILFLSLECPSFLGTVC